MKTGFTLIELLVVIAIITILASVVFGSLSSKNSNQNANYKITFDNKVRYVESYTKEDSGRCIYLSESQERFCGDYLIKKLVE